MNPQADIIGSILQMGKPWLRLTHLLILVAESAWLWWSQFYH